MVRRTVWLLSAMTVSALLLSCGKKKEEAPATAALVGPPAAVMAEVASWKALGGVIDLRELAPKPAAPGTPNAADLHKPLIDMMLTGLSENDENLIHDPWDSPATSLKYVLETYEKELATIKRAVAMPYCNWGTPFEEGLDAKMLYLGYSRTAARLLVVDARVRKETGDYDGAVESIIDIFRLGDQVRNEPVGLSMLVADSLDVFAIEAIERLLKDEPEPSAALIEVLGNRRPRADLRRALLGEGAILVSSYVELAGGARTTPVAQQPMSDAVKDGLVWHLQMFGRFAEQANLPYYKHTAVAETPAFPTGAAELEFAMDAEMVDRLCSTAASLENYINMAHTALQLRDYKARHGEYPDPATYRLPEDVFTGESMIYVLDSSGFTLRVTRAGSKGQQEVDEWVW